MSKVYLVGAGPGDPDLLTVKATKVIAFADVILIDDLVDPAVLVYARPEARVRWVGKRGGCESTPQAFIEKLMVREACEGHIVVRLKGGDPTIFGRLGEELLALQAAKIPYEIVSGISSGIAAAASCGISLTHRDHSHGVVFVTGHPKPNGQQADITPLVKAGYTVVVYMGLSRSESIVQDLLLQGCEKQLPVAIVQAAATVRQKVVSTTLGDLRQAIAAHGINSPALLVLGKVTQEVSTAGVDLPTIIAAHAAYQ
jgi:uroporphyrin-III C-methyltransferase